MDALPPGVDLSQVPLQENPSGAPPDFDGGPSLIAAVRAVGISLGFIALVLIVLRLSIWYRLKRPLGLDDAFVVIAFALAAGYTGVVCSTESVSRHAWDTPISALDEVYLKKLFVTSLLYGPMLFFAKASILILYHRMFRPERWFRVCLYITLAILFGAYWMTVPLCFNYCMPHNGAPWELSILENCNHLATPGLVQAAVNIAADIAIFVLPLPIVLNLHLPMGKKIGIAAIFATGFFALVASALTVYYRVRIIQGFDATWAGAQTFICIQAEVYVSIFVACMPSLSRMWKVKFKETKLYGSLKSFLTARGKTTYKSTDKGTISDSVSTVGLQGSAYQEIRYSTDFTVRPKGREIYKMTTVELTSTRNFSLRDVEEAEIGVSR
ncbi:hypothetical protein ACRALDRAFT_1083809 [Sodiomyces alcalophilus JCM 7366]|uniref:uncharacterized protein n=1 Tax=Sodiomyces alcalophilus JCM 7366 TaxID=591952 RepID=UPI0039B51238